MADDKPVTAAPTLESVSWNADGSIRVVWENNAATGATYTQILFYARRSGSGQFVQINSVSGNSAINAQAYSLYTGPGLVKWNPGYGYEIAIKAYGPAGLSVFSTTKGVPALKTPTPSITTVSRDSATSATVNFTLTATPPATVTSVYAMARVAGTTTFRQVNATGNGTARSIRVPIDDSAGAKDVEVYLYATGPAGNSTPSSTKEIEAWWQPPAAPTDLVSSRQFNGTVRLALTYSESARKFIAGIRIYRATLTSGFVFIGNRAGKPPTWNDTDAVAHVGYRYQVETYGPGGSSTSRASETSQASVTKPNSPSSVTAVYLAGDEASLSWNTAETSSKPYTGQKVLRRNVGASAWSVIARLASTAKSYTDPLGPDKRVEYAIQPFNAAGDAETPSSPSDPVATTPARPPKLTAAWQGATSIKTSWDAFTSIGNALDVEFATDRGDALGTWYPGTTPSAPLPITARSWVHSSVSPTVPHWYRLRVRNTAIPGAPASAWLYSAEVKAQTKPLMPTMLMPTPVDASSPVRLQLVHNPVDGTAQTLAQIRYRKQGVTTWTTRSLTTQDYYDIAAAAYANGDILEVQGRTAGASGVYSDWSEPALLVTLRARIPVTITSPAPGPFTSSIVKVAWTAPGQVSAVVELLAGSDVVLKSETVTLANEVTFDDLEDGQSYTIRVTARDAYQDSVPATVTIAVTLIRPAPPVLGVTWRPGDAATLLTARPSSGLTIQRRNLAPALELGQRTAPAVNARQVSLSLADDNHLPGLQVNVTDAGTGLEWFGLEDRADGELVGAIVTLTTLGSAAVAAEVVLKMNGNQVFLVPAAVPVWPDSVTVRMSPTSMPGHPSLEVRSTMAATSFVATQVGIIGTRTGENWSDYFDINTVTDGLHYRRVSTGVVVETAETMVGPGDIPVSPMVRLTYLRWDPRKKKWLPVGVGGDDWGWIDRIPPLNQTLRYKARGYSESNGYSDSNVVEVTSASRDVHLNYGPAWSGHVSGGAREVDASGRSRQMVATQYADRDFASIARAKRRTPGTLGVSMRLLPGTGVSTVEDWLEALSADGDMVFRDTQGLVMKGGAQEDGWSPVSRFVETLSFQIVETGEVYV